MRGLNNQVRPQGLMFKANNLCMIAGVAEDRKPFEDVIRIDEDLEAKYDK